MHQELLIKTEELSQTDNKLIFIEKDIPLDREELYSRLDLLRSACNSGKDELVRKTLKQVVPTYKAPEEINTDAENAEEMKNRREIVSL